MKKFSKKTSIKAFLAFLAGSLAVHATQILHKLVRREFPLNIFNPN